MKTQLKMSKKGMVQDLSVIAYSIVAFAIIVGVGVVVLVRFGNATPEANATTQYLAGQLGQSGLAGLTYLPLSTEMSSKSSEFRLISLLGTEGQDRTVNVLYTHGLTTDKESLMPYEDKSLIYSLNTNHT